MSEEMKRELNRLGAKVEGLASDVADVKAINRRVISTLVRLEGKVDDMAERMATKDDLAVLRSDVKRDIDGLAGKVDEMRYDWAKHEGRLSALEKRRS